MRRLTVALTVLLWAAAAIARAGQGPVFSSHTEIVRIDALVTTQSGQPMHGLTPEDFELRDNGVLQQVDFANTDTAPLDVVLALDMSGSVAGVKLNSLRTATHAVLDKLAQGDQAALVTFGMTVRPSVALTQKLTEVRTALDAATGRGQTSLIDGVFAGLMIGASATGRSLLLVFSDGVDTASWLTGDAVVDAAKRGDVVVYGVLVGPVPKASFLKDLAAATGGDVLAAKTSSDLQDVFLRLLAEYRQRYLLGYVARGVAKGGWHRIEVRVKGRNALVKARPGYLTGS